MKAAFLSMWNTHAGCIDSHILRAGETEVLSLKGGSKSMDKVFDKQTPQKAVTLVIKSITIALIVFNGHVPEGILST